MGRKWFGRRTAIILALAVVVLVSVAAVLPGFIEGYRSSYQSSFQEGLLTGIHDSCVSSATDAAQARRVDVRTPELTRKIEDYCSCVANSVRSGNVTTAELNVFTADPQAVDPAAVKVREVIASCLR